MTCAQAVRQLATYSAAVLTDTQNGAMEAHLAGCDSCRRQLAQYTALDAAMPSDRRAADSQRTQALLLQLEQERLWRHWSGHFLRQTLWHLTGFGLLIALAGALLHSPALSQLSGLAHGTHIDRSLLNNQLVTFAAYLCLLPLAWGIVAGMNALLARAK